MPSFFDEYVPYRPFIDSGQYSLAIDGGIRLLNGIRQLAPQEYYAAHKGTPFYVMGFAAFASHDYDTATFLFDAAVSEDLKNHPGRPETPALLFMQLNDENQNQLAKQLVSHVRAKLGELVDDYNGRPGARTIAVDDIRSDFLARVIAAKRPELRTLATTLLSFVAEWGYRSILLGLTAEGSREPFFLHLFKGCLLFESLLKQNPRKAVNEQSLGRILNNDLRAELCITQVDVRESNFDALVKSLTASMAITQSIECAGKARNTLGHDLVWISVSLDETKYDLLFKNIASACLHAISTLYR
jgi:hypothetical protein